MTRAQILALQTRIGTTPDGFWGPKSIAACQRHLRALMPNPHPFPADGSSAFANLYGPRGVKDGFTPPMKKFRLPFTVYYGETAVSSLSAHTACADSLERVFQRLASAFPDKDSRRAAGILTYDGIYNPRMKRGSTTSVSMHAWACAIDVNAARNGNRTAWPVVATMPIEVMECFAAEGWIPAGAFWGRDAMHFQATA